MANRVFASFLALVALATSAPALSQPIESLRASFQKPPAEARPWVYWFWLDGNITREGMTADLEAMKRVGIGGVLIMEVDQGAPAGAIRFGSPAWRELFRHMLSEAHRLGLEVNMNNDAGWTGSGGPWITPDKAMQQVVWSETSLDGPTHTEIQLPQPPVREDYYQEIAVLAFPRPAEPARKDLENEQGPGRGCGTALRQGTDPLRRSVVTAPWAARTSWFRSGPLDLDHGRETAGRRAGGPSLLSPGL